MYSFPNWEPVCCSMSSSNCCFLTCTQISQEAGKAVWYPHLFKSFSQFVVIHTLKGFDIVNKVEVDVVLELSCFFDEPMDVGNLISGSSAFSKTSLNIWKLFRYCWSLTWRILSITLLECEMSAIVLEKEMATHSSILAWRIPGTEEPGGLLSMGSHRVGHDWSDLAAAVW